MERIIGASKAVMFYSIAFFFVVAGLSVPTAVYFFAKTTIGINATDAQLSAKLGKTLDTVNDPKTGTLAHVARVATKLGTSIDTINDPNKGTLMLINQDIFQAKSLITHVDLAARTTQQASKKEVKYFDEWNKQITHTLGNVDKTVINADTSISTLTSHTTVAVDNVTRLLKASTKTIDSANTLISNPDIPATLANTEQGTAALAGMAEDSEQTLHSVLHPEWPGKIKKFFKHLF